MEKVGIELNFQMEGKDMLETAIQKNGQIQVDMTK